MLYIPIKVNTVYLLVDIVSVGTRYPRPLYLLAGSPAYSP